jgi:ankyrin repeat protein
MKEFQMKKGIDLLSLTLLVGILWSCLSMPSIPPLITAAQNGNLGKVKQLVEGGADINERSVYGHTALERAASNGHLEIVGYLLTKNANDQQKAFQNALENKHINVAKLFIDGGYVDVNNNTPYFRSFFNDDKIPFEQRMENVNAITNGKLNSPYILQIVQPENYRNVIDFFYI